MLRFVIADGKIEASLRFSMSVRVRWGLNHLAPTVWFYLVFKLDSLDADRFHILFLSSDIEELLQLATFLAALEHVFHDAGDHAVVPFVGEDQRECQGVSDLHWASAGHAREPEVVYLHVTLKID